MDRSKNHTLGKLRKIPILLPTIISIICIYGFIVLYSAAGGNIMPWAYKQMIIFCIFMPIAFFIALVDVRLIYNLSYYLYFFVLLLLFFVEIAGKTAMGATRWIDFGILRLQPSEPAKIVIVLMLAKYFHDITKLNSNNFIWNILIPLMAVLLPVMLIIKQPDLGTGIVTLLVAILMFVAVGTRSIYFIVSGIIGLISLPIIWRFLHNYQKNRILIFIDPEKDPLGAGYNIIQSKIAIGSGGLFGKGFLHGTQSHLSFLPEYQTDFIFAFLTEELGFVGGIILLFLYMLVIINSLAIAMICRSIFGKLIVVGITSIFFYHIFINIGMVMGLMPVVGVPLPLVSYGGTMMVSMLIGLGLIMNAAVNQHKDL
jgi:rod shape determining protein RodA